MSYEAVINYYEREFVDYFSRMPSQRMRFMPECRIGYVYLGDQYLELVTKGLTESEIEDVILFQAINRDAPESVVVAFERHIWYSKYSLTDVFAYKITLDKVTTFAICINGYAGDAWDNGCAFIEIYDDKGELIASAELTGVYGEGEEIYWLDRQIKGYDFVSIAPPSPLETTEGYSYTYYLSRYLSPKLPMWKIDSYSGKAKIITANLFSHQPS